MAHYTGPKNRLARREGIDLGLKTVGTKAHAELLKRLNVPPGVHGPRGKKKTSEYGLQLREKQKVKRMYGVLERQFRKAFEEARKWRGNTGEKLIEFMERRLDNTVYRMGFSPTRSLARQLVSHGHVMVNGEKVSIPSFRTNTDMVVTLKQKSYEIPAVKKQLEDKGFKPSAWLERKGPVGKVVRLPELQDVSEDISMQLIVEHYSR
jgi:small subunit ribosomal protein S4